MRRLILALAALLVPMAAAAYEVEVIQDNGDPANRVDITVMGDGYRDIDQDKLTNDVNSFLATFWGETPLGEYRGFFNVRLVHVISNENGADNGSYGADRDTALGAYYNCYNIDRLLCVNTGTVFSIANTDTPGYDTIFVIVNDPKYGGAGGSIAVFSVHSSAGLIAIHEFGHTFGDLADEYEDPYPGYPNCGSDCPEPNATTKTVREQVKWNIWIDAATPVPTPETSTYQTDVGVFEGCRYQSSGVYRPRQSCMMRSLGAHFGEVCAEAMLLSTYGNVDPIDSVSPSSPLNVDSCQNVDLVVSYPAPDPDTMVFTWRVDGQVMSTGPSTYTLDASSLGNGSHQVMVEVDDGTTLVRNDPQNLLHDTYTWTVNVSGATGACIIDSLCYYVDDPNPANACEECQPLVDPAGWTVDDTNPCGDGLYCNGPDTCQGSACVAGAVPCSDDGIACTDTCDEATDQCNVLQAGTCLISGTCQAEGEQNPANPCEGCQSTIDPNAWTPDDSNDCEDGQFCNGVESCQGGTCLAGAAPCTDDGLACTTTCDEDADGCNVLEATSCLIAGACQAEATPNPANPCEACQPAVDPSGWTADDTGSCEDGLFCNGAESCQGGACETGTEPCVDDGLACTDTCDETSDACNLAQPGLCVVSGACQVEGAVNPQNPCESCQPTLDPAGWSPYDAGVCDDGEPCTTSDRCSGGTCTGDQIPGCCLADANCDDGFACTVDACEVGSQQCSNVLSGGFCLVEAACHPDGAANPENACQTCNAASPDGWTDLSGVACDDGDACTLEDMCTGGVCASGERACSEVCPCEDVTVVGGCSCGVTNRGSSLLLAVLALLALGVCRTR